MAEFRFLESNYSGEITGQPYQTFTENNLSWVPGYNHILSNTPEVRMLVYTHRVRKENGVEDVGIEYHFEITDSGTQTMASALQVLPGVDPYNIDMDITLRPGRDEIHDTLSSASSTLSDKLMGSIANVTGANRTAVETLLPSALPSGGVNLPGDFLSDLRTIDSFSIPVEDGASHNVADSGFSDGYIYLLGDLLNDPNGSRYKEQIAIPDRIYYNEDGELNQESIDDYLGGLPTINLTLTAVRSNTSIAEYPQDELNTTLRIPPDIFFDIIPLSELDEDVCGELVGDKISSVQNSVDNVRENLQNITSDTRVSSPDELIQLLVDTLEDIEDTLGVNIVDYSTSQTTKSVRNPVGDGTFDVTHTNHDLSLNVGNVEGVDPQAVTEIEDNVSNLDGLVQEARTIITEFNNAESGISSVVDRASSIGPHCAARVQSEILELEEDIAEFEEQIKALQQFRNTNILDALEIELPECAKAHAEYVQERDATQNLINSFSRPDDPADIASEAEQFTPGSIVGSGGVDTSTINSLSPSQVAQNLQSQNSVQGQVDQIESRIRSARNRLGEIESIRDQFDTLQTEYEDVSERCKSEFQSNFNNLQSQFQSIDTLGDRIESYLPQELLTFYEELSSQQLDLPDCVEEYPGFQSKRNTLTNQIEDIQQDFNPDNLESRAESIMSDASNMLPGNVLSGGGIDSSAISSMDTDWAIEYMRNQEGTEAKVDEMRTVASDVRNFISRARDARDEHRKLREEFRNASQRCRDEFRDEYQFITQDVGTFDKQQDTLDDLIPESFKGLIDEVAQEELDNVDCEEQYANVRQRIEEERTRVDNLSIQDVTESKIQDIDSTLGNMRSQLEDEVYIDECRSSFRKDIESIRSEAKSFISDLGMDDVPASVKSTVRDTLDEAMKLQNLSLTDRNQSAVESIRSDIEDAQDEVERKVAPANPARSQLISELDNARNILDKLTLPGDVQLPCSEQYPEVDQTVEDLERFIKGASMPLNGQQLRQAENLVGEVEQLLGRKEMNQKCQQQMQERVRRAVRDMQDASNPYGGLSAGSEDVVEEIQSRRDHLFERVNTLSRDMS